MSNHPAHTALRSNRFAVLVALAALLLAIPALGRDFQVSLVNHPWTPLAGEWQQYFGMHRSMLPTDPWDTIRAPAGYGWHFVPPEQRTGPERPRVMTGSGTIRLDLDDMTNGQFSMPEILTKLQDRGKTGVFNMFDRVGAYPLDRDLAYWTYRLMYGHRDPAYNKDHLFIQLGNEINGVGQWNPWPTVFTTPNDPAKIAPYVEGFFVEAVKGLYQASRDTYGPNDKTSIKVLGPSVANAHTQATFEWTQQLMDYPIQGSYTNPVTGQLIDTPWSGMEGQTVADQVDILSIQYPFQNLAGGRAMLQQYHDAFIATGKVEGIWLTEELYVGGPRHLIQRAARFMDFVADNNLTPGQARLLWFLPDAPNDPAGMATPAIQKLAEYAGEGALSMQVQSLEGADFYLFINDSDPHERRLMAILEPTFGYTLGGIRFYLPPAWANLDWTVQAYATDPDTAVDPFIPGLLMQGDQVRLDFQRDISTPLLISLTAPHAPEPAAAGALLAAAALLRRRRAIAPASTVSPPET